MDLQAVAAGTHRAPAAARAASHLTGRQIVPALMIVTVLLLTLVILFGPEGPLSAPRRQARRSRTARRPQERPERQRLLRLDARTRTAADGCDRS